MFEPNTLVVCINDDPPPGCLTRYTHWVQLNRVYTVRDIVPGVDPATNAETCAVYLDELVNPPNKHGIEPGFAAPRFRELTDDELERLVVYDHETPRPNVVVVPGPGVHPICNDLGGGNVSPS